MHLSPVQRYFSGLAEHTFQYQLGVVDPQLIDYISDLLTRFVRTEVIFKVRDKRGRPLRQVAEMLVEAQHRVGNARREVHRHIGDFTLFWSGVYPEALRARETSQSKDELIDFCEHGKRAYLIASTIDTEEEDTPASSDVLERLSSRFELCAYGLREVRREWERRDDDDMPRPFLIN